MTSAKGRKQTQAITALLTNRTLDAAADACGLSKRTLIRWMREESFRCEYERAQAELLESALNALRGNGWDAAKVLRSIAKNPRASFPARVSAARASLETLLRAVEIQDLEKRIRALEETAEKEN